MNYSLEEYSNLFVKLSLTELSVEEKDFKLTLKKEAPVYTDVPSPRTEDKNISSGKPEEKTEKDGVKVNAPLLGIFYEGNKDGVCLKTGDKVSKGDVLCTIEAMQMMNDVTSPVTGTIKAIYAKEGDLVEYNQCLFVIGE